VLAYYGYASTSLLHENNIDLQGKIIQFDCRAAEYLYEKDALELILWRANDGMINGVSDIVNRLLAIPDKKKIMNLSTRKKLEFLKQNDLLRFKNHQIYGTLLKKEREQGFGLNKKTNEKVPMERNTLIHVNTRTLFRNVLFCVQNLLS
jgi:hypothetical protein